jgi:chromatin modification-related protein YNG2
MAIPGKISTAYAEIEELSNQKQEIAQRLVALIEQTRTRLDIELGKVRAIQGEPPEFPGMPKPLVGVSSGIDTMKMPALAMTESLKAALAGTPIADTRYSSPSLPATPVAASPAVPSHKRT